MIEFFRDTLSGSVYSIMVVVCLFVILASIGYLVTASVEESKKKITVSRPQEQPVKQ